MQQTSTNHQEVRRQIHRASYLLMGSLLVSRVAGFFREWILAQVVGVSELTDVYYASFSIPDFLNYLMAAGALSISFIPILADYVSTDRSDRADSVFRSISTYMGSFFLVLILVSLIGARWLGRWVAPGFNETQQELLVELIRIILPAQFFFYWGGLAMAVQQTHGKFIYSAIAPIFYNLCIILFGVLLYPTIGVKGFSVGVLVGALVGHGVLQRYGLHRLGYSCKPLWKLDAELKSVLKRYILLSLPIMLGFSIVVTDEWVSKYFASTVGKKAISWLAYARIELRVPVAIIGQVAGIASFPYLARLWASGNRLDFTRTLLHEIQKVWAFATVATVFTVSYALPITHALFGGSRFTDVDFAQTALALKMFGLGLVFWVLQVLLARGFYARQITWLPSLLGTAVTVLCLPLYGYLAERLSFAGLALAGTIGVAFYCTALTLLLAFQLKDTSTADSFKRFRLFLFTWSFVAVLLYGLCEALRQIHLYQHTQLTAMAEVLLGAAVIGGVTFALLRKVFVRMTDGALV